MLGALRASALLVFLGSVSAQFCEPCSYYASMSDVTTGCSGYCHCGTCGTGRINNIDFCLCDDDPSCSTSCPNYRSSSSYSSRRRSSSSSSPWSTDDADADADADANADADAADALGDAVCDAISTYGCRLHPDCCDFLEFCDEQSNCIMDDVCSGRCKISVPKCLGILALLCCICSPVTVLMRKKFCPGCCSKGADAIDAAHALVLENANPMGAAVGSHVGSTVGEQLGGSLGSSIGGTLGGKVGVRYDPVQETTPQPTSEQPTLGSTLEIVAPAVVRNGSGTNSKNVGKLKKGKVVTALEICQQDGHERVRIGQDQWISRITDNGTILAQPMSQQDRPVTLTDQPGPEPQPSVPLQEDVPTTIEEFLASIRMSQYESTLMELGVSAIEDLADVAADDLAETGMKPLEVKRFVRAQQELMTTV